MGINGVGSFYAQNYDVQNRGRSTRGKSCADDFSCMGNATSLSESSDNGKRIGITTVGDRGYIAMYADSSTEQDPIVKVGDYEVRVKDVNPNNATKMEMFALMSYMDDKGFINNQGMKSFNKMTAYSSQAEYNGYCSGISDENAAWTVARDWIGILGNAKETYFSIPQTYEQGLTCQKLIDSLNKWCNISETYIPDTVVSRHTEYIDPDTNEKVPVVVKYVTSYSQDGISCREEQRVGDKEQSRKLWTIHFENEEDLGKVKNFLEGFEEEQRLTFASQRTFWKDFLDGRIELADFKEYFASTNNGIIDYEKEIREGKTLREITGSTYAGYLNNSSFVGRIYSESELQPSWYRNGIIDIQEVYDSSVPTDAIHIRAEALKTGYGKEASIPVGGAINDRVQIVFAGAVGSANQYFQYADETGIIDYNGIIFYCDSNTDTLKLGDCSNPSECIQISLTDGGSLMVNRDNLEQLFDALPFFSPEDMMVILQVLQKEKMADNSLFGAEQEDDRILELVKEIDGRERKSVNDYQE